MEDRGVALLFLVVTRLPLQPELLQLGVEADEVVRAEEGHLATEVDVTFAVIEVALVYSPVHAVRDRRTTDAA